MAEFVDGRFEPVPFVERAEEPPVKVSYSIDMKHKPEPYKPPMQVVRRDTRMDLVDALASVGQSILALQPTVDTSAIEAQVEALSRRVVALEIAPKAVPEKTDKSRLADLEERLTAAHSLIEKLMEAMNKQQMDVLRDPPLTQSSLKSLRDRVDGVEAWQEKVGQDLGVKV